MRARTLSAWSTYARYIGNPAAYSVPNTRKALGLPPTEGPVVVKPPAQMLPMREPTGPFRGSTARDLVAQRSPMRPAEPPAPETPELEPPTPPEPPMKPWVPPTGRTDIPGQVLQSAEDASVNWVIPYGKSVVEARYVKRESHYISVYLSSHTGCAMGCKMCHLTATGQTIMQHSPIEIYLAQLRVVLDYARGQPGYDQVKRVNINFMARGEPLMNRYVVGNWRTLYDGMVQTVRDYGCDDTKVNISTIMPQDTSHKTIWDIFEGRASVYSSLYSPNTAFRAKWLPRALPYAETLRRLRDYEAACDDREVRHRPVTFHWALIHGENDSVEDAKTIADDIFRLKFTRARFNLIRYNSPDGESREADEAAIKKYYETITQAIPGKIISRVGFDVKASCGMFIGLRPAQP